MLNNTSQPTLGFVEDGGCFSTESNILKDLPPGYYSSYISGESYFNPVRLNNEIIKNLSEQQKFIIRHVNKFWSSEEQYNKMGAVYKRGILLYGLQGTGKSTLIRMLVNDIISNNGHVLEFNNSFDYIWKHYRDRHPEARTMVVIEDIDKVVDVDTMDTGHSEVVNFLDGIYDLNHTIVVATTNNIQNLPDTITNRPGRFDIVKELTVPTSEDIKNIVYGILERSERLDLMDTILEESKGNTPAKIKEIIIQEIIYND